MTRIWSMFLSVSEKDSDYYVKSGVRTMHAVKGVGCVRFQLVKSFSGGGRSDVCPKAEVALSINLGGHGACNYVWMDRYSYVQRE
jgi:hypothetical protein